MCISQHQDLWFRVTKDWISLLFIAVCLGVAPVPSSTVHGAVPEVQAIDDTESGTLLSHQPDPARQTNMSIVSDWCPQSLGHCLKPQWYGCIGHTVSEVEHAIFDSKAQCQMGSSG